MWETDHVQAAVLVDVDGQARRPWITWFTGHTECATNAITGVALTPGDPSRESVLAALRSAVLREDPCGPIGGVLRVDRGKDFLSRTVTSAFDLLDMTVEDLPACNPHLKGTVEGLNRVLESMFLAALPGYARQPRPARHQAVARRLVALTHLGKQRPGPRWAGCGSCPGLPTRRPECWR
ncbi:hypothetical protein GCM10009646_40230 [Streptomyces aureus]